MKHLRNSRHIVNENFHITAFCNGERKKYFDTLKF